jgi:hypothetical protein
MSIACAVTGAPMVLFVEGHIWKTGPTNAADQGELVQDGVTAPLYVERDELKTRLMACEESLRLVTNKLENITEDRTQLQYQVKRLDEKLIDKDRYVHRLPRC